MYVSGAGGASRESGQASRETVTRAGSTTNPRRVQVILPYWTPDRLAACKVEGDPRRHALNVPRIETAVQRVNMADREKKCRDGCNGDYAGLEPSGQSTHIEPRERHHRSCRAKCPSGEA